MFYVFINVKINRDKSNSNQIFNEPNEPNELNEYKRQSLIFCSVKDYFLFGQVLFFVRSRTIFCSVKDYFLFGQGLFLPVVHKFDLLID